MYKTRDINSFRKLEFLKTPHNKRKTAQINTKNDALLLPGNKSCKIWLTL